MDVQNHLDTHLGRYLNSLSSFDILDGTVSAEAPTSDDNLKTSVLIILNWLTSTLRRSVNKDSFKLVDVSIFIPLIALG